jgi:hypothetical protein
VVSAVGYGGFPRASEVFVNMLSVFYFRRTLATGLGSRVRVSHSVGCYSTPELPKILSVVEPVSFGGDDSDFLHVFLLSGLTMVGKIKVQRPLTLG